MARDSTVRPWLAAGLTVLVAGLGHLYLRQWVRAVGWFGLIVLTGALFGPENLPQSPGDADMGEIVPVVGVALLAVVDAYLQARRHNARIRIAHHEACANCGRSVDPDLEFCHWCSEPLVDDSVLAEADEQ